MKRIVTYGEVMLRLSTPKRERFCQSPYFDTYFGGGEANVATSLANFGYRAAHITCLPDNLLGKAVEESLLKYGVDTDYIVFDGSRLGIYFLEKGSADRGSRVIYDRRNSSFSNMPAGNINWSAILKKADWFHWSGITPALSDEAAEACLEGIQTANSLNIPISCDINYRSNLWKYGKKASEVMPAMIKYSTLLFTSLRDAGNIFNIELEGDNTNYLAFAKELKKRYPRLQYIVATIRQVHNASSHTLRGIASNGEEYIESAPQQITHIVERIGGGDAFAAGMIFGLLQYRDYHKALNFATAASVLKHTFEGDVNLATKQEVEALMEDNL